MSVNDEILYQFLPQLLLRAPHYSFSGYDLSRLPEVLHQQDFRNAIWLASPEFYRAIEKKDFDFNRLSARELHTLGKYYNRICFRPTPFGTFASFTLLQWADGQSINIGKADQAWMHLLPDQETLTAVNAAEPLRDETLLIVNPCLYRVGKIHRYSRTSLTEGNRYEFGLDGLEAVNFHNKLLALFKGKRLPVLKVLNWIALNGACSIAEARNYLDFLIREQVLLSQATGSIIYAGLPYAEDVGVPDWKAFWEDHRTMALNGPKTLPDVSADLKPLIKDITDDLREPSIYAALEKPHLGGGPSPEEQQELINAVHVMSQLSLNRTTASLSDFITAFRERFDQEKVPLLLALDEDTGIPYGDSYAPATQPKALENIRFPVKVDSGQQTDWTAIHRMIFRLWTGDTLREPHAPMIITDDCMTQLRESEHTSTSLPQSLAIMYRKAAEHLVIDSADGVAATALIGRFSCFSKPVHDLCLQLAEVETHANPDVVFADIGQLSDRHVDNINRRRQIYPFEIPINVFSELPLAAQLQPADLVISVRGKELILESTKLGKRVIPRLSTAYNFRHNQLPLFRFLCDLQYQGIRPNLTFDLEQLFPGLAFYPRVMYGKTVLSLARWHFKDDELAAIQKASSAELPGALDVFRSAYRVPRHISFGYADQQLVFDLTNRKDAKLFIECLKGHSTITIREYLVPGREVLSGHNPMAGQMIAFLKHDRQIYKGISPIVKDRPVKQQQRSFPLGSDWLYLKLFCTPRIADELLVNIVHPFMRQHHKVIQKWFFIRYMEKGNHLRLRIHADPAHIGTLLFNLQHKMAGAGYARTIRNYQGETYQRELERYGNAYSALLEECFCAGSKLVILSLRARGEKRDDWAELKLALQTASLIIWCFLPDERGRHAFLNTISEQFIREFNGDKQFRFALDVKYREVKRLQDTGWYTLFPERIFTELLDRVTQLNHAVRGRSQDSRLALLADLVHMQMNRTFAMRQREQELLVYYILQKQLRSEIARQKRSP